MNGRVGVRVRVRVSTGEEYGRLRWIYGEMEVCHVMMSRDEV